MQSKVFCSLALVLGGVLLGCSNPKQAVRGILSSFSVSQNIERHIPQLKAIQAAQSPLAWKCREQVKAAFFLREHPRYHPAGEFPREPATPIPCADIFVTVAQFQSADDALNGLKESLHRRQAAFRGPEHYEGGMLYEYRDATGGVQDALCQLHEYVVEIECLSPDAEPLAMTVMDTLLGEVDAR